MARIKILPNGCWEWTAGKYTAGYGCFRFQGKDVGAHRFSAKYLANLPNVDTKHTCHTCDTPSCVNPSHLFIGSHADNHYDKMCKIRTGVNKLSPQQVLSIRDECKIYGVPSIAKRYDVSENTIRNIKRNLFWKHL